MITGLLRMAEIMGCKVLIQKEKVERALVLLVRKVRHLMRPYET